MQKFVVGASGSDFSIFKCSSRDANYGYRLDNLRLVSKLISWRGLQYECPGIYFAKSLVGGMSIPDW